MRWPDFFLPPINLWNAPKMEIAKVAKANEIQIQGNHYKKLNIQTWDYVVQNNIPYLEGNIIKYVSRWKDKGGLADLEKAQHYLQKLIEVNSVP